MFWTDQPSTMSIPMPDWRGGIMKVGGRVYDAGRAAAAAVFSPFKAFSDPVGKGVGRVAEETGEVLRAGAGAVKDIGSGFSSGFKWATALIIIGIFLYALAVLSPFLPKPQGGSK